MRDLLISYEHSPAAFDNDLSSEKSIRYYYKSLYNAMPGEYQDYSVKSDLIAVFIDMHIGF